MVLHIKNDWHGSSMQDDILEYQMLQNQRTKERLYIVNVNVFWLQVHHHKKNSFLYYKKLAAVSLHIIINGTEFQLAYSRNTQQYGVLNTIFYFQTCRCAERRSVSMKLHFTKHASAEQAEEFIATTHLFIFCREKENYAGSSRIICDQVKCEKNRRSSTLQVCTLQVGSVQSRLLEICSYKLTPAISYFVITNRTSKVQNMNQLKEKRN